jgi:hypothetical protein
VKRSVFAFATDFEDEGLGTVLDNVQHRGGLDGVTVAGHQVAHLHVEALARAGTLGHHRPGPGGQLRRRRHKGVGEPVVLVERPEVAVGDAVPAGRQARAGDDPACEVGRCPDRPVRGGDPERLEPLLHVGGGAAAEDRPLPDRVDLVGVRGEHHQVEVAVLQHHGRREHP